MTNFSLQFSISIAKSGIQCTLRFSCSWTYGIKQQKMNMQSATLSFHSDRSSLITSVRQSRTRPLQRTTVSERNELTTRLQYFLNAAS